MNRVDHQLGFILKSQAFKETSFIHQFFSFNFGVVSIISKGSRTKNSKTGSLLQLFRPLMVSWTGKSELKTLTSVEQDQDIPTLKGRGLFCGFYVNELLIHFLHNNDSHPRLFEAYSAVIRQLSRTDSIESNLRQFEKILLEESGYAVILDGDVETLRPFDSQKQYNYIIGKGAVEKTYFNSSPLIDGSTLINLKNNCLVEKKELHQAKILMRRLIDHQLNGKILKSRELFS